jgi:hypothetical protein
MITAVSVALAQANAKVSGTVTDPNGAAVPGASVKLINQATKIESATTSNEDGYFNFVNVNPRILGHRVRAAHRKRQTLVQEWSGLVDPR